MVVVFGSVNLDLVAQVARIPAAGETLAGHAFACLPGGKGANQALAACRAGAHVRMFGAVGRDAFAAAALANLEASGIDLTGVVSVDAPTGVALIHVDARGENAITVVAGANGAADADQVPDSVLHAGNTLLVQLEVTLAQVRRLAERAYARGARVILNAAPAMALDDALFACLDVLVVNEIEAATIGAALGMPSPVDAFAHALALRHPITIVVTRGARGVLAVHGGETLMLAAPRVDVVDTTGAGDAFTGAIAAALDRGVALRATLAEGVAAGALACTGHGAQTALPHAGAIRALAATI
jgi:ribokinase